MNARLSAPALLRRFYYTLNGARASTSSIARRVARPSGSHRVQRPSMQTHRSFSSSHSRFASLSSHPPGQETELVHAPTLESLQSLEPEDSDGPDIDLIPSEEAKLELTERAAQQLRTLAQRRNNPNAGLRIAVESGGCHGYQYKLELATERKPDDYHFSHPTIKPSSVIVDAVSMSLLKGSVIDFATELIGSSFKVAENPQAKGSGCGCGVSWELKI
ncbi:uncharacterized protein PHACADRAFT_260027 [Phanerochaete carnosa HHB-10118-sp]|uniref:Core domain-containing protein n=1 Tax=Phanerochaete carnosa (strain HHB-10118-sp) TaxID=650164 RepID=K5W376_PHACS|nr:uncharacterized protein PHACADRAFT_260027 [Phanerochaete carnosa HHB-10118-sp]EKM53595.1 hypothetical protein PHACADRAFT_260027 [Phanerochaete carnosa HHB-10118-sp]